MRTKTKFNLQVDEAEGEVIIFSLQESHDRIRQAGGNQYGPLKLEELQALIESLRHQKRVACQN